MEYILFIHNNSDVTPTDEAWQMFFEAARASGMFQGGSAIANAMQLGNKPVAATTASVGGFMRFASNDRQAVIELLHQHPVLVNGGTLELCEMPSS